DILQTSASQFLKPCVDLVPDLIIGAAGDQNPTRVGNSLEAGGDVDTLAVEIAAFNHDVTQGDSDAQNDATLRGQLGIRPGHSLLQVDGALHSVTRAGEPNQHAIARHLEHPAAVASD